jgi:hypothetical protein
MVMNNRWREIAVTCWEQRTDGLHFDQEMFAELIVQECLTLADSIRDECDEDGEKQQALGAAWVGLAIARHFGVEE